MMRTVLASAFFALAVAAGGCAQLVDPFDFGEIEVVAETRAGEPAEGVHLRLFRGTRQLDFANIGPDGRHVFRFVPAARGGIGIWVFQEAGFIHMDPRFISQPYTFAFEEGERRSVAFTMLKWGNGSVAVRVSHPDGEPVEGALLRLIRVGPQGVDPLEEEGGTDESGEHRFQAIPLGWYEVTVLPGPGYVVPAGGITRDGVIVDAGWEEEVEFLVERL